MTVEEVATKLASVLGAGWVEGTNVFLSDVPSSPDAIAVVTETGGSPPVYVLGQAAPAFHEPTVQFLFRGASDDAETTRTTAKTAFDAFIALQNVDLTSVRYYLFTPMQEVFPIGNDDNARPRYVFNMRLLKDPS